MTKEQLSLLKKLYLAHSPSRKEEEVAKIVQTELNKMQIPFETDDKLQIYRFVRGQPIFAAHMDQVGRQRITKVHVYRDCVFGDGNLGADDKNGVWILLQILKKFPNISFIFSTCEECGFQIDNVLKKKEEELKETPYGLVFDRRNSGDIIGWTNDYCNRDFQDDVHDLGKEYGYAPTRGSISDCDQLARFGVPCVNLSCGYYNPHSEDEFTVLAELENALVFADKILSTLTKNYTRVETKWRGRYTYQPPEKSRYKDWDNYGFGFYDYEFGYYDGSRRQRKESSQSSQRDNIGEKFLEFANWGFPPKDYYASNSNKKSALHNDYPCTRCNKHKSTCVDCTELDNWYGKNDDDDGEKCPKCHLSLKDVVILDAGMYMCDHCGHMFQSEEKKEEEDVYSYCSVCTTHTHHVDGMCTICYSDNEQTQMPF